MDISEWSVATFETKRGEKPVDEYIKKRTPQTKAKIIHAIRLLKLYGNMLGMPHVKTLGSGLYELRIRGKEELRIFYCFKQKNIYLLHAFKKQTQKTPQKDLDSTIKRMEGLT